MSYYFVNVYVRLIYKFGLKMNKLSKKELEELKKLKTLMNQSSFARNQLKQKLKITNEKITDFNDFLKIRRGELSIEMTLKDNNNFTYVRNFNEAKKPFTIKKFDNFFGILKESIPQEEGQESKVNENDITGLVIKKLTSTSTNTYYFYLNFEITKKTSGYWYGDNTKTEIIPITKNTTVLFFKKLKEYFPEEEIKIDNFIKEITKEQQTNLQLDEPNKNLENPDAPNEPLKLQQDPQPPQKAGKKRKTHKRKHNKKRRKTTKKR
jgi:hypothetical protein